MANLNIFVLVCMAIGAALCFLGLQILWKQRLFRHALTLLLCLSFLAAGGLTIVLGLGMLEYHTVSPNRSLATIHFKHRGGNRFSARIKDYQGGEYLQELEGDFWQLEARLIGPSKKLIPGAAPMLRFEGFYVVSRTASNTIKVERTVERLHRAGNNIDSWKWLKRLPKFDQLASLEVTRTMKKPLKDMAIYSISLARGGLVAEEISSKLQPNDNL